MIRGRGQYGFRVPERAWIRARISTGSPAQIHYVLGAGWAELQALGQVSQNRSDKGLNEADGIVQGEMKSPGRVGTVGRLPPCTALFVSLTGGRPNSTQVCGQTSQGSPLDLSSQAEMRRGTGWGPPAQDGLGPPPLSHPGGSEPLWTMG